MTNAEYTDLVDAILDRSYDLFGNNVPYHVLKFWNFDIWERKPAPAYPPECQSTDLDMVALLNELVSRDATIKLPHYTRTRKKEKKTYQSRSEEIAERGGLLINVHANKDTFRFNMLLRDRSVKIDPMAYSSPWDQDGAYRSFTITDFDGMMYPGMTHFWFGIDDPAIYNMLKQLAGTQDGTVGFRYFAHPNRWVSFFGRYYFIAKLLIQRLEEESKHLNNEIKRLKEKFRQDLTLTEDQPTKKDKPKIQKKTVEKGRSITVKSLQVELDPLENRFAESRFPTYDDPEEYPALMKRRREIVYKLIPRLRLNLRATELAYYWQINTRGLDVFPSWISKDAKWESGFKLPRKRIEWNRLVLPDRNVAIRFRVWDKKERVSEEYVPVKDLTKETQIPQPDTQQVTTVSTLS